MESSSNDLFVGGGEGTISDVNVGEWEGGLVK